MDTNENTSSAVLAFSRNLKIFFQNLSAKKQVIDTVLNIAKSASRKVGEKTLNAIASNLTPNSKQILSKNTTPPQRKSDSTRIINNLISGSG